MLDKRDVVHWITFERQIRNFAVAVAQLMEGDSRAVFIISEHTTALMVGNKIGRVLTPIVQHKKSVAPEGTVGEVVHCFEQGIHIGFKYLPSGEIVGEIAVPSTVFKPAPTVPLIINWEEFELTSIFSNDVFKEMLRSDSVFSQTAPLVNLNISRSRKVSTRKNR